MLKKIYKLTSFEIKNIFVKKNTPIKTERGVFFDIKYKKENILNLKEGSLFKTGIVISKKNFKNSVDRNKIRRQIYTIIENYKKNLKDEYLENSKIFLIFYIKKEIKEIKFSLLEKEVYNTLNRILKI